MYVANPDVKYCRCVLPEKPGNCLWRHKNRQVGLKGGVQVPTRKWFMNTPKNWPSRFEGGVQVPFRIWFMNTAKNCCRFEGGEFRLGYKGATRVADPDMKFGWKNGTIRPTMYHVSVGWWFHGDGGRVLTRKLNEDWYIHSHSTYSAWMDHASKMYCT